MKTVSASPAPSRFMNPSITIITVVFNNASSIVDCLESVSGQSHPGIIHIIIDGGSTDGTLEVINEFMSKESGVSSKESKDTSHFTLYSSRVISEPDNGLYDAMNKGIRMAEGDIIGILNSDDVFADENTVSRVVGAMTERNVDSCYADIDYVDRLDTSKVVRRWRSGAYEKKRFHYGWMPPHPTFFVKRSVYEKYGLLNLDFPVAAGYELMLRFLYKQNISTTYIPTVNSDGGQMAKQQQAHKRQAYRLTSHKLTSHKLTSHKQL